MNAAKVLILDRDNPNAVIRERLRSWGADNTENLHVLTRSDVPSLKDKHLWAKFPTDRYSVVIVDALNSFTEGVTEKEGKQTTQVLATLLDLARKGVAILILHNTTKDGANMRGRGEVADRVDIIYEVRDATGFTPSGTKPWWEELPESGEKTFVTRASRRKHRTDYRLAFIPSKFRIAREPEPFCLEIHLPKDEPWTLKDVTHELVESGEEAMERSRKEKEEQLDKAAAAVKAEIIKRKSEGKPLLKSEAEELLQAEGLRQLEARQLVEDKTEIIWTQEKQPGGRGKGKPIALLLRGEDDTYISTTKKQSNKVRPITSGVRKAIKSHPQSKKRRSA
jgi:AAA domain